MCHTVPDFAELILLMRKERPTQEFLDRGLGQCIISPEEVPEMMQNINLTILSANRKQVSQ